MADAKLVIENPIETVVSRGDSRVEPEKPSISRKQIFASGRSRLRICNYIVIARKQQFFFVTTHLDSTKGFLICCNQLLSCTLMLI